MAIAGRVAIVPKGEWSQSVTYDKLDLVTYNGNTFIAYKSSVGVEPVGGDTWMLVMQGIDPQDIDNIIDGTTQVGNAAKLGGKGASEYVQKTGDSTIDGNIELKSAEAVGRKVVLENKNRRVTLEIDASGACYLWDATNNKAIGSFHPDGDYRFNGIATECLPKTGGTVGNGNNAYPLTVKGGSTQTYIPYVTKTDTVLGYFGFYGVDDPVYLTADKSKALRFLHTGNKPTGTYNGNGSATSRTINIGGIGKTLCIRRKGRVVFADSDGALCIDDEVGVTYFEPTVMNFTNGTLTIATDDSKINHSGWTYTYTLL